MRIELPTSCRVRFESAFMITQAACQMPKSVLAALVWVSAETGVNGRINIGSYLGTKIATRSTAEVLNKREGRRNEMPRHNRTRACADRQALDSFPFASFAFLRSVCHSAKRVTRGLQEQNRGGEIGNRLLPSGGLWFPIIRNVIAPLVSSAAYHRAYAVRPLCGNGRLQRQFRRPTRQAGLRARINALMNFPSTSGAIASKSMP